jgi:cytochrome c oxidase subunit 4
MADMANDDKPDTADTEAPAEPKEPKSQQGSSEEQPPADKHDATAPKPEIEPTKQDEGDEDEDSEPNVPAHAPVAAAVDHGHGGHGADHGLAHTMPIWMLIAVLGALMLLTILTVSVTNYDLGSEGNLVVGMVIATVKAGLVVTFFMHLLWDKKFHLILFLTAVLFVVLFLSMSITDRGEYQGNIDLYTNTSAAPVK